MFENPLNKSTIDLAWTNPSDEKASEFYIKRYLNSEFVEKVNKIQKGKFVRVKDFAKRYGIDEK